MPTASDYRSAATTLEACADDAGTAASDVLAVHGDTGIEGGRYEGDIDRALDASRLNADGLATRCRDAAAECRRRATICDEYAEALRAHERAMSRWRGEHASFLAALDTDPHARGPGPAPSRPSKPFSWIEAS